MGYAVPAESVAKRLAALPSAHAVFVAVVHGLVVGWVHVVHDHSLIAGARVELAGLAVSEQHQGGGVGGLLLRYAEQWAARRGVGVVHLRSGMERDGAHRFYENHGYQRVKAQYAFAKNLPDQ